MRRVSLIIQFRVSESVTKRTPLWNGKKIQESLRHRIDHEVNCGSHQFCTHCDEPVPPNTSNSNEQTTQRQQRQQYNFPFFDFFKTLLVDVLLLWETSKHTILIITLFDDVLLFWKMLRIGYYRHALIITLLDDLLLSWKMLH